jgi:hypothetical protein
MKIRCFAQPLFLCLLAVPNLAAQVTDNASTSHVFAEFADGKFSDGSYYRSTTMVATDSTSSVSCTWTLYGLRVTGFGDGTRLVFSLAPGSWDIRKTPAGQDFKAGYATLTCSRPVTAQILYTYFSASGQVLSEATVFSSPAATIGQLLVDQTNGSQLGIAIANHSDTTKNFLILAGSMSGDVRRETIIRIPARSQVAQFLNEMIPTIPQNFTGAVHVLSDSDDFDDIFVIGLRYTGIAFTTIPPTRREF